MSETSTLTAGQVARQLQISTDLFLRTRGRMEELGFPKPLRLASREMTEAERAEQMRRKGRPPLRWSRRLVERWIDGEPAVDPDFDLPDTQPGIARAARRDKQRLQERLGT